MSEPDMVSPISIDLGAETTGVFLAHYKSGNSIEDIEKKAKVYTLKKDNYTLLMNERTASRHQRRCYDRKQMVKRLFKLIWEEHFSLKWNDDIQQTTSFLFNRRGFTFLTEEYDSQILSKFPKCAYDELPDDLKFNQNECQEYDFANFLIELNDKPVKELEDLCKSIDKKPQIIKKELDCIKTIKKYCENLTNKKNVKNNSLSFSKKELKKMQQEKLFDAKLTIPDDKHTINIDEIGLDEKKAKDILKKTSRVEKKLKELKGSIWNFKSSSFGKNDFDNLKKEDIKKVHLNHLAFALHKIYNERVSGSRPRKDYFKEIKEILKDKNHTHKYLREFCEDLNNRKFKQLDDGSLAYLISHLSNFELKPLRKYFNDRSHKKNDYWKGEKKLKEIFEHWTMKQWRIGDKDRDKKPGGTGDYKKFKKKWQEHQKKHPNTIINFWLKTDPLFTIPPYQDINNRRPPHCQSLILNSVFLDKKYPDWKKWLSTIEDLPSVKEEYLDGYKEDLKTLKSSKQKPYFNNIDKSTDACYNDIRTPDDLKARSFQFILDRARDNDPLKLNEIYSYVKKYHQIQSTKKEKEEARKSLEDAIQNSKLPKSLEISRNYDNNSIFQEKTFLHLVNSYYKFRQKARDGRIYIHPKYHFVDGKGYKNTGYYEDDNCLLTYCNRKPRRKRYQMCSDFAALFQISTQELEKLIESEEGETLDEKLFNYLNKIETLKTNCAKTAKEQKDRKGNLKLDIEKVYGFINSHNKSSENNIKKILNKSKVKNAYELYKRCKKSNELLKDKISKALKGYWKDDQWKEKLDNNPASGIYILAQINNIVFKERNGNAQTCAVCSSDNAKRMQAPQMLNRTIGKAKASRLPAISTRVIDGAVMKMANILGKAIATEKWGQIEKELESNKKIHIPIITELNRFEFEPNLNRLKGKSKKKDLVNDIDTKINHKEGRIKSASNEKCPYTGRPISSSGEIDHIIPRSSRWGTLNDEANLIYVSKEGNSNKGETEYNLDNLDKNYKQEIFNTSNKKEITSFIETQISCRRDEHFNFGQYFSFSLLKPDQQKAFRHALFLDKGHPLRKKVIHAINNRTRTMVNGTQRYFAEVLANNLYKKAKRIEKNNLLSFDYFDVEAWSASSGDNVYELRKAYENIDNDVKKHEKGQNGQEPYSHLIDAKMAFAIAASKHRNEGSLKLSIDDSTRLWPSDKKKNIFNAIKIDPQNYDLLENELKRKGPYDIETCHRQLLSKREQNKIRIGYQIHRDSIIKENFIPLIKYQNEIKKGFTPNNANSYQKIDFELLKKSSLLKECSNKNNGYKVWRIDKRKAQEFLMDKGFEGVLEDSKKKKICKLLDSLSYQTLKKSIQSALSKPNETEKKRIEKMENLSKEEKKNLLNLSKSKPETIDDALQVWDIFIYKDKFEKYNLTLPLFYEWSKLKSLLEKEPDKSKSLQNFLKDCDMFRNECEHKHQKVRKVYSLPLKESIGNIRLRRKSWDKKIIYQTVPEESIAKYQDCRPHTILSKNSIPRGYYEGYPKKWEILPREWQSVTEQIKKENNNKIVHKAEIKYKDADRSQIRLTINTSDINELALPQDKDNWEGKIVFDTQQQQSNNHYYPKSQLDSKWFQYPISSSSTDFNRKITMYKKSSNEIIIEFIINKKTKTFLKNSQ